jgi:hypothetical protein
MKAPSKVKTERIVIAGKVCRAMKKLTGCSSAFGEGFAVIFGG